MRYPSIFFILIGLFTSCGSFKKIPESELTDDYYLFRQQGERYTKVYVHILQDSLAIIPLNTTIGQVITSKPGKDQFFLHRSFDIDVLTVPFKYRPSSKGFPRQLNTEFNGNVFLGYRWDRYRIHENVTPAGMRKRLQHRAFTFGTFGGFGTSSVGPFTTNYLITDEYNGLILSRGLSAMVGLNKLTVGLGIGWDYLTDRDKDIWIYQNEAWYGLTLSLNLN